MGIGEEYIEVVYQQFKAIKNQGDRTLQQLTNKEFNWTPNKSSNSIATIIKHMNGNMISRWTDFLTTDGEKAFRQRDEEFMNDILSDKELFALWEKGWETLFSAIQQLAPSDLLKEITIRGEPQSVIQAIERQVAHYGSHVGQIIYIAKQVKDQEWKTISIPRKK